MSLAAEHEEYANPDPIIIREPQELADLGYLAPELETLENTPLYQHWRKELDFWIEQLPGLRTPREKDGSGGTPPRPHQLRHAAIGLIRPENFLAWSMGVGKCHGRGTEILMFDGSVKKVEDVVVGDQLMGPDSKPRNVLSLARGQEMMYKVTSSKGDEYTVNESHILSLKRSGVSRINGVPSNKWKTGDVVNIAVRDFLRIGAGSRTNTYKQYKVGVEFDAQSVPLDPYFVGMWLGDGASHHPSITTADPETVKYLQNFVQQYPNLFLRTYAQDSNQSSTYAISSGKLGRNANNTVLNALRNLSLLNNKHIPDVYKINSKEVRLQLLAGLIDSDGHLCNGRNSYEITQKNEKLADDIIFLARSLGFAAYKKLVTKACTYKGEVRGGKYHKVMIWGYTETIPVKLDRKAATLHTGFKDPLALGIRLEPLGVGEYYGFTIDSDHLYLLGNFVVTHNTSEMVLFVYGLYGRHLFKGLLDFMKKNPGKTRVLDSWLELRGKEATGTYLKSKCLLPPGTIQIAGPRHILNQVWMVELARMNLDWAAEVITSEAQIMASTAPIWFYDLNNFPKAQTRKGRAMKASGRGVRLKPDGKGVYFAGHQIAKLISKRFSPSLLVIDEAHRLKDQSERTRCMRIIRRKAKRVIELTGTPMDGWVEDAATLLSFAYGENSVAYPFTDADFSRRFTKKDIVATDIATGKESAERKDRPVPGVNLGQIPAFSKAIRHLMHRLTLTDPEVGKFVVYPPVVHELEIIKMDPDQAAFYRQRHQQGLIAIKEALLSGDRSFKAMNNMLTLLMELRMASTCPWVLGYQSQDTTALVRRVVELVGKYKAEGRKGLLGTTFVQESRFIYDALQAAGFSGVRLYTQDPTLAKKSMSASQREAMIERFQDDPDCDFMIANKDLVAEGLNLSETASYLISCSKGWRANIDAQWDGRVIRPGQIHTHVNKHTLINGETACVYVDQMSNAKAIATASMIDMDFSQVLAPTSGAKTTIDTFELAARLAQEQE